MVTCLVRWGGRDLETMMASDVTIISTSLIVGISVSIAGSSGGGNWTCPCTLVKLKILGRWIEHPLNRIPHKHRVHVDLP